MAPGKETAKNGRTPTKANKRSYSAVISGKAEEKVSLGMRGKVKKIAEAEKEDTDKAFSKEMAKTGVPQIKASEQGDSTVIGGKTQELIRLWAIEV